MLRPARKHKFRVEYIPIKYEVDTVLRRSIIFNGNIYPIGLPIQGEFKWDAWRFGYEYDFIYRDRGFLGVIAEAKYTHVSAELATPLIYEFAEAKAPIPADRPGRSRLPAAEPGGHRRVHGVPAARERGPRLHAASTTTSTSTRRSTSPTTSA